MLAGWVVAVPDNRSQAPPLCVLEENIVFIEGSGSAPGRLGQARGARDNAPLFSE